MRSNHPKPRNRSNSRAHRRALAAAGDCANYGSSGCGAAHHAHVATGVASGRGSRELRLDGQKLAIHEGQLAQLQTQLRGAVILLHHGYAP
jgi:hypothetical protein